jgi:predicted Zn-dependent peptidase
MLFKGTPRRNAQFIAKEIDSVGGVLNGFTSRELSCYYVKVMADKLPMAVDLLGDLFCHSLFDLDEIEKERRVILQEISMMEDNPEEYVHDLFSYDFWRGHPLGRPIIGDRQTVGDINRQQMLDFLDQRYSAGNLVVVAAGEVDHAQLVELVNVALDTVPEHGTAVAQTKPALQAHSRVVYKELEQPHICLGVEGVSQCDHDRYVAYLLNTLLGGNMSSRLFQQVREELGLSYSVYSYLNAHSDSGALVVYAGTSDEDAPLAVRTILSEMNRLRGELVAEHELQAAKDYLKGSMMLALESSDNRMTRLAKNELYLGHSVDIQTSRALIDQVSSEEIMSLAGRLFNDRALNVQIVGRVREHDFPTVDICLG